MAFSIGILSGRIELEDHVSKITEIVNDHLTQLDNRFGGLGQRVAEGAASFFTAQVALDAMKMAAEFAADAIATLTTEGSEAASISDNFDHLTESVGRLSSTLLNELREGLHNTVTDLDLMKTINQDLAAGMNLTDDQFRTLADGAFALAQATGIDVKDAFDKVNDALLTGRTRAVEMLTGKIDLTQAEEDYADKLNTTVDRLTAEEKLSAARIAILDNLSESTERLGVQTDGMGEIIQQATTAWSNFQTELGKAVATSPVLIAGLEGIRDALIESFGGNQEEAIRRITEMINEGAITALEFAKTVVDGIGAAGYAWNGFLIILEMVKSGWAAIAFGAEGALLAIQKIVNFASGGFALDEQIKTLTADMDRWYKVMADGVVNIENHEKAQTEWAMVTGEINEKIEGVRQKMIAANEQIKEGRNVTKDLAVTTAEASDKALLFAASQGQVTGAVRQSAEEMKKAKEAMKEIAEADEALRNGQTMTKHILEGINDEIEKQVKKYLDAGIAIDKLAAAYGLTARQAQALNETWQKEKKAADDVAAAWKELNSLGKTQEDVLRGVSSALIDQVQEHLKAGASLGALKAAYGLTDAQVKAIQESLKAGQAIWMQEHANIDAAAAKVRTLAGEWITAAEAKERANQGGSFTVNRGNLAASAKGLGIPESLAFQLAELGFSFQEIHQAWLSKTWDKWKPQGPRIPGFREGGWGDFGEGTMAMLHGKEAIIPFDKMGGALGNNVVIYVNGTAEETARKIKEIFMRDLTGRRQFGLNR